MESANKQIIITDFLARVKKAGATASLTEGGFVVFTPNLPVGMLMEATALGDDLKTAIQNQKP